MVDTPLQAALRKAFDSKASVLSGNPTGTIIFYLGTDVPEGYLLCNGAAVSRTTYAKLFAVLGTRCGAGDGASTFNLPNFHGRVPQATTNVADVGKTLEASLPNIRGGISMTNGEYYSAYGVIKAVNTSITRGANSDAITGLNQAFEMNATNLNAIYSGSKLQVNALNVLACVRC